MRRHLGYTNITSKDFIYLSTLPFIQHLTLIFISKKKWKLPFGTGDDISKSKAKLKPSEKIGIGFENPEPNFSWYFA